jgi:hypothetical protein
MRQAGIYEPQGLSNAAHDPKTAIDRRKLRQTRRRKNNPQILFPIFQENQCEERDPRKPEQKKKKTFIPQVTPKTPSSTKRKEKSFCLPANPTRIKTPFLFFSALLPKKHAHCCCCYIHFLFHLNTEPCRH